MRIRKNAKKSPLVYVDAHLNPGVILKTQCPLNQNPWDVMSFSPPSSPPPSSSRVNKIDVPVIGNNSMDMIVVVEREELSDAGRKRNHHNRDNNMVDCIEEQMVDKPIGLCVKTNRRSQDSKNSYSHCLTKEKQPVAAEATSFSHCPKRKKAFGSCSNTDEFHYYSSFRPCWGKTGARHGGTNGGELSPMVDEDSYCVDPIEDEEMMKKTSRKKRGRKSIKTRSLKSLM